MVLTLSWKETREHWPIWLTMVIMTGVLGFGLAALATRDAIGSRITIQALTILGMAATYGVVCGAMMFAGERESGTLVFLDIFSGRRELLWIWKVMVGVIFVVSEALAVALLLHFVGEPPPNWAPVIVGIGREAMPAAQGGAMLPAPITADIWLRVLPVVTLEAYAWGLLGSALMSRVVAGAGIGAVMAAPVWLISIFMPPPMFLGVRVVAAAIALVISMAVFLTQSREAPLGPPPRPEELLRTRKCRRPTDGWGYGYDGGYDRGYDRDYDRRRRREETPILMAIPVPDVAPFVPEPQVPKPPARRQPRLPQALSPTEVLWWLTFQQAWTLFTILAIIAFVVGLLMPSFGQLLWPIATLFIGVGCGAAAFGPEQHDLSYQFLATQHFPLKTVWNVKIFFWLTAAVLLAGAMLAGGGLVVAQRNLPAMRLGGEPQASFQFGTLRELMGTVLYLSVWLLYGFGTGQLFVLFCRKNVLAVLLGAVVGAGAVALWLPSLLCLGMGGWQLWLTPVILLLATRYLVRAWAGGRIKERRPLAASMGFGGAALGWALLNFSYRAWEIPEVGEPLDLIEFTKSIPLENRGGQRVQEALAEIDSKDGKQEIWLEKIADARQLPAGVIELPSDTGQPPLLRLLPPCKKLSTALGDLAVAKQQRGQDAAAFEHLAQALALSRSMRQKAPLAYYMGGIEVEAAAFQGLNTWLNNVKPNAPLLQHALAELNRHAAETPPPMDCLRTECFRSGGAIQVAALWSFYSSPGRRVKERWLAGWIAMSLEAPWEEQRKIRLWEAVWAGLMQGMKTPHWEQPKKVEDLTAEKDSTREIMRGWLVPADGPGSSLTRHRVARLLDVSWLADERLFPATVPLRTAATRARCRTDAHRLALTLGLYQLREGKTAPNLTALIPKYLPELPVDPYTGKSFRYRISQGEDVTFLRPRWDGANVADTTRVRRGQAILWSTGPDGVDHGGMKDGDPLADADPQWTAPAGLDLLMVVPRWR